MSDPTILLPLKINNMQLTTDNGQLTSVLPRTNNNRQLTFHLLRTTDYGLLTSHLQRTNDYGQLTFILQLTTDNGQRTFGVKLFYLVLKLLTAFLIVHSTSDTSQCARFNIFPRASGSLEYSSNIFLDTDNPQQDCLTILSAGFTANLDGQKSGLSFSYDPAYAHYHENTQLDNWRHRARFVAFSQFARQWRLQFQNDFIRTEDPITEQAVRLVDQDGVLIPIETTVRRNRAPYNQNAALLDMTYRFGPDNVFNFGYGFRKTVNTDPTLQDPSRQTPFANLSYWFLPRFGFEMAGTYTRGEFEQGEEFVGIPSDDFDNWFGSFQINWRASQDVTPFLRYAYTYRDFFGDEEDFQIHDIRIGTNYMLPGQVPLSVSVGFFVREFEFTSDNPDFIVNVETGRGWRFQRSTLNLGFTSGYDTNDFGAINLGFEIYNQFSAGYNYNFTRYLSGDISVFFRRSDFIDTPDGRVDYSYRGPIGLSWQALRWLFVRISYSYNARNSSRSDADFEEHRGLLRLTATPYLPYQKIY